VGQVLRGQKAALRARFEADVPILQRDLYDDIEIRVRADSRPWRPIPDLPSASPYWVDMSAEDAAFFSIVDLGDGDRLAGEALLWGIDLHNRGAHVGLSILPEFRGRGFGTEVTNLLCYYGFSIRGLHRLQVDALANNEAMIRAARRIGFTQEGTRRGSAWVDGCFVDEVILGLLGHEWQDRPR
jgi:RimJ/RimL family protein N-acetyltransferase